MVYNSTLDMLRLETGFDDSLFESDNENLTGYTNHHRLLVPALIAPDVYRAGESGVASSHKLEAVLLGTQRTSTLAFEAANVESAHLNPGWLAVKQMIDFDGEFQSSWRIAQRNDPHHIYSGIKSWAATRSIMRVPRNEPDELSFRLRERYTFTAAGHLDENDIRGILIDNDAPDDVMVATATVYAINKLVPKPELAKLPTNAAEFPALAEMRSSIKQK